MKKFLPAALAAAGIGLFLTPGAAASPYESCSEAANDGVYNIPEGSDNYWPDGDRDDDGIACESTG